MPEPTLAELRIDHEADRTLDRLRSSGEVCYECLSVEIVSAIRSDGVWVAACRRHAWNLM